ncbi:MAG: hypothetical protein H0X62_14860 [Bacteroidetes bacterium]|nr:hypothetical protein [Bacteroidota bacterium]
MRLLILVFFLAPIIALGQSTEDLAQQHLRNLKNGAIFIRLPTSQNKIKAYLDAGQQKKAEKTARSQQLENIKLYLAFKSAYDFSEVYFFYNLSSKAIQSGNFKGHLLNENLEPDPEINYAGPYYIAEFDVIQTTGLSALVIKDSNFNLLQKPFPYYAKLYNFFPLIKKNNLQVVIDLNKGLHSNLK